MMPLFRRASHIAVLLLVVAALQHCAQSVSQSTTPSMRQGSDGLEVIRWTTTTNTSTLEGIVVGFQTRPVMNPMATELLIKEGFLAAIVDQKDIAVLREKLGSNSMDIRTNFGVLSNWREVFHRKFPKGQALSINGRALTPDSQMLQISARGWATPTESGGCFQLEIAASVLPLDMVPAGLLTRADRPSGELIANTGIETCLQHNEVFILLSANQGPFKSGRGPGSEVPLPPTVGRFLLGESADLEGQETPIKGVTLLAFVPHMSTSIEPAKKSVEIPSDNSTLNVKP